MRARSCEAGQAKPETLSTTPVRAWVSIENIKKVISDSINNESKKEEMLSDNLKIDIKAIENDCKKKYSKIYHYLNTYSKKQLTGSEINEVLTKKGNINDFLPSIGSLARMLEKEAEITIKELINKYKLNFHPLL